MRGCLNGEREERQKPQTLRAQNSGMQNGRKSAKGDWRETRTGMVDSLSSLMEWLVCVVAGMTQSEIGNFSFPRRNMINTIVLHTTTTNQTTTPANVTMDKSNVVLNTSPRLWQ